MTYMFILKCALKLVLKNILYYDARSEKHQIKVKILIEEFLCCHIKETYRQVQKTHSGISYVKVSLHDFSDFLTLSNHKPCADQLEDFKLRARLKSALYYARQTELHLSVRQNGILGGKGVVLVSVSANEI